MDINYQELGKEIAKNIVLFERKEIIWSNEDCADYLRVSLKYFRDVLSKRNGFPAPIVYESNRAKYKSSDVIEWAMKQQRAG